MGECAWCHADTGEAVIWPARVHPSCRTPHTRAAWRRRQNAARAVTPAASPDRDTRTMSRHQTTTAGPSDERPAGRAAGVTNGPGEGEQGAAGRELVSPPSYGWGETEAGGAAVRGGAGS